MSNKYLNSKCCLCYHWKTFKGGSGTLLAGFGEGFWERFGLWFEQGYGEGFRQDIGRVCGRVLAMVLERYVGWEDLAKVSGKGLGKVLIDG